MAPSFLAILVFESSPFSFVSSTPGSAQHRPDHQREPVTGNS
jgi:hypothetical protein